MFASGLFFVFLWLLGCARQPEIGEKKVSQPGVGIPSSVGEVLFLNSKQLLVAGFSVA